MKLNMLMLLGLALTAVLSNNKVVSGQEMMNGPPVDPETDADQPDPYKQGDLLLDPSAAGQGGDDEYVAEEEEGEGEIDPDAEADGDDYEGTGGGDSGNPEDEYEEFEETNEGRVGDVPLSGGPAGGEILDPEGKNQHVENPESEVLPGGGGGSNGNGAGGSDGDDYGNDGSSGDYGYGGGSGPSRQEADNETISTEDPVTESPTETTTEDAMAEKTTEASGMSGLAIALIILGIIAALLIGALLLKSCLAKGQAAPAANPEAGGGTNVAEVAVPMEQAESLPQPEAARDVIPATGTPGGPDSNSA
ncbi:hypothetical protein HDE_06783 [Halotydeus destructor]|nr:hypothetical protein HDE_06783 [Halotydeus destructor]